MKMKEVCAQTGLSDRAVRFYIEQKLVQPYYTQNHTGRKTFDFFASDVQLLQDIAVLRRFGFSVAEIRQLQARPDSAPAVLAGLRIRKQQTLETEAAALAALNGLEEKAEYTLTELAAALAAAAAASALPAGDTAEAEKPQFSWMLLAVCAAIAAGIGLLALLADMVNVYLSHGEFGSGADGFVAFLERVQGSPGEALIMLAMLAVPVSIYFSVLIKGSHERRQPVLTAAAVLAGRDIRWDNVIHASWYTRDPGAVYQLRFITETGTVLQLRIPKRLYSRWPVGTAGLLTYQGTRMEDFVPHATPAVQPDEMP
ncbi:MAG: MerR family transcriptional regulator [Faecalibacterium sp.]|nr:MerR family transcriptional regulator [Faecalibacterium sp.]